MDMIRFESFGAFTTPSPPSVPDDVLCRLLESDVVAAAAVDRPDASWPAYLGLIMFVMSIYDVDGMVDSM